MAITATTVVDIPTSVYTAFANTAMAVSGDWLVAASNTGDALLRFHIPSSTPYITKPWHSGTQTLNSCVVRPGGNVAFFRNDDGSGSGWVYEVVPSTGATTDWSTMGYLGAEGGHPAVVGDGVFFGGYGVGAGGPKDAVRLDLTPQTRNVLGVTGSGVAGWYGHSTRDAAGDVWLMRGTLVPWRVTPSTMTQPIATAQRSSNGIPFLYDGRIWVSSNTAGSLDVLDPVALTLTAASCPVDIRHATRRASGTLAVIATTGGGFHAVELSAPNGAIVDPSVSLPASNVRASVLAGDSYWTIGETIGFNYQRIIRVDFTPSDVGEAAIDPCTTQTFAPGSVVPQGADGAVVYSSGALDSFGTDETPVDWPTTGAKIKAIEVELTSTTPGFTQNGQVQVAVTRPDGLSPLPGATSDASASYSGASGFVNTYRTSLADCFYLSKFGGWLTDYTSPTASIGTSNTLQLGIIPAFGQDWDIRFEVRRASWSTGYANTVSGTGTTPLIRCDAAGLYVALDWYFPYATTVPWATLGAVNGDWLTVRVTFDLTNRLRVWIPSGGGWTLVQSAALTGYTETATKWGAWYARLGNGQNASGIGQIGLDGDLRSYVIRDPSTIIMDLGLDRMPTSTSYSWATTGGTASWFGLSPIPPRVTGSTVPATVRVRADLETPCLAEDLRLIVDAQTGALTVDEILLEAECGGGIYRDGRVHLS